MPAAKNQLILKFPETDTPFGVSRQTFDRLVAHFGLNPEQVIHLALRQLALKELPQYEPDDGPLTKKQIEAIRAAAGPAKKGRIRSSLF